MTNKTTKDIIYNVIDAIATILIILSTCWLTISSIQYGYDMHEEIVKQYSN